MMCIYIMYACHVMGYMHVMLCYVHMFELYDVKLHFLGYAMCDMMHECNV